MTGRRSHGRLSALNGVVHQGTLPRSPQGSLPAWVGWPLTGRGSHPLDDTQGFMTYSSIPLDRPAWPHHATTSPSAIAAIDSRLRSSVAPGGCITGYVAGS